MNLSLSETIALAHRWEKKAIEVNAMMLSDSSAWVIKFAGRVSVSNDTITLALDDDRFEFRLTLLPNMTFAYSESLLEIKTTGWRCCFYEPG